MFKTFGILCLSSVLLSQGFADDPNTKDTPSIERKMRKSPSIKPAFSPFSGKVKGNHVRVRIQPDLEGQIIRELSKNELISVIDEEGDFYVIAPPSGIKAYVFRSFILDNTVEGNHVNVRLQPNLESPVIGHLNTGDRIKGNVSAQNNKWLEIDPPATSKFYVAKEFIDYAGGPELRDQMEKRQHAVAQLLESASLLVKAELSKPFDQIDFERLKNNYKNIINDYTDFPNHVLQAKESLAKLQEAYLEKRINYLEAKATHSGSDQEFAYSLSPVDASERMQMWEPLEEALYLTWAHINEDKSLEEYYDEQRLAAIPLAGLLEEYSAPVKNKPGDFVVKDKNGLPVAYVYSTRIDLQKHSGKKVTLLGSPRPNNHFAFPAYYVHEVE